MKVNLRKGSKYAEAREWAYDLIANSTGTTAMEMAEMMAEQFGFAKSAMGHTLHEMVGNGSLKVAGSTLRKGKRTHVLAAARRRTPKEATVELPNLEEKLAKIPWTPVPTRHTTNGAGVYVVVETEAGLVKLTLEQAKTLAGVLGVFK